MNNHRATIRKVICEKIQIGFKYIDQQNNTNLVVTDDSKNYYKYFQSYEMHDNCALNNNSLFVCVNPIVNSRYMNAVVEFAKQEVEKREIEFNMNLVELCIPIVQEWKYLNSKALLKRYNK